MCFFFFSHFKKSPHPFQLQENAAMLFFQETPEVFCRTCPSASRAWTEFSFLGALEKASNCDPFKATDATIIRLIVLSKDN